MSTEPEVAPEVQGLVLFEQYEATGSLLVVTSDKSALRLEPGDFIVRRAWATASEAVEVNRAALTTPTPAAPSRRAEVNGAGE